jgi:hypothetical protein
MMKVGFTSDTEKKRVEINREKRHNKSWELLKSTNLVEAVRTARDMGWKENKVQVRYERIDAESMAYFVEPYEAGCGCRGLLKYKDFFD